MTCHAQIAIDPTRFGGCGLGWGHNGKHRHLDTGREWDPYVMACGHPWCTSVCQKPPKRNAHADAALTMAAEVSAANPMDLSTKPVCTACGEYAADCDCPIPGRMARMAPRPPLDELVRRGVRIIKTEIPRGSSNVYLPADSFIETAVRLILKEAGIE